MDDLLRLEERLGFQFHDRALLLRALTHRSYLNENADPEREDNERLEFLGDAVLDFVVGAYLYHHFPDTAEGELTTLRAALVRAESLADFARGYGLGEHLQLGLGESESGGRDRIATLSAAFEAVLGACYLDQGLDQVSRWIEPLLAPALTTILADSLHKDAKSEFQVWAQGRYNLTPRYEVIDTAGPDHAKTFTVRVVLAGQAWGMGQGRSKQIAAQAAAAQALLRAASAGPSGDGA
jgi:ribonuclease-3